MGPKKDAPLPAQPVFIRLMTPLGPVFVKAYTSLPPNAVVRLTLGAEFKIAPTTGTAENPIVITDSESVVTESPARPPDMPDMSILKGNKSKIDFFKLTFFISPHSKKL
jgi:hypothetical protein